jgi:hypothetical protein
MPVVDTTRTFTNNEQITSTKLNEIMDNSSFVSGAVVLSGGLEVTGGGQMQIATSGITTERIADSNVTTTKISDGAITPIKLANSDFGDFTVSSGVATIDNNAITTVKIADSTSTTTGVTTSKIADANITASKLSGAQTGSAPIFAARAWMSMKSEGSARTSDGKTLAISNTSAGVCTVTYPSHGFKTGHQFWFQFSSLIVSKVYTVTVVNANSFTVQTTYLTATTTPTVSIALYNVLGSGNVNSVSSHNSLETTPAYLIVNLNEPMPDNRYSIVSISSYSHPNLDDTNTSPATQNPSPNQTTNSFRIVNNSTARYINMVVFG